MEQENIALSVENLYKNYGEKKVLKGISFTVNHGEIIGFLGPNGAGKSTTMNIITGYLTPTDGTAKVEGLDILENSKAVKSKIGYLPENPPLYFDMTVWEYLSFIYDLKKVTEDKKKHITAVMDKVKITNVQGRMIRNLSKGYKQRVGLAQALIGNPPLLILDEPTVGLDPSQIMEIRDVIRELGKERTVILSTHILQEVSAVCDRVIIINSGEIVAMDTVDNLTDKSNSSKRYRLSVQCDNDTCTNIIKNIDENCKFEFLESSEDNVCEVIITFSVCDDVRKDIFYAFANADKPILEMRQIHDTLEDIFTRVTQTSQNAQGGMI